LARRRLSFTFGNDKKMSQQQSDIKCANSLGGVLICGGILLGLFTLMGVFLLIGMASGIGMSDVLTLSKGIFVTVGLCGVFSYISLVVGVNLRAKKNKPSPKPNDEE